MNRSKLYAVLTAAMLLTFAFLLMFAGTNDLGAGPNITPTLIVTARHFLPVIFGIEPLYTPTPTLSPPTVTPWASWTPTTTPSLTATIAPEPSPTATNTPEPSPTATNTPSVTPSLTPSNTPEPSPTATNTSTPTATSEFQLPKPTLYAINNADRDGNYTVAWSAVPGATRYFLKENFNGTSWETLYDGPGLSVNRINMPPGDYCYNVRAFGPAGRSAWAGEQCTTVDQQSTYVCEFQTLADGPRSTQSDMEILPDGRLFITGGLTELGTTAENAHIFDPTTREFEEIPLPMGGGREAVVLADGRVMLTVYGNDPHTMIYDPVSDEVSRLDTFVGCLEVHRNLADGFLLTFCGSSEGSVRNPESGYERIPFELDINYSNCGPESFAVPRGANSTLLTNGVVGHLVAFDNPHILVSPAFDHRTDYWVDSEMSVTTSSDTKTLFFTGGAIYVGEDTTVSSKEAYAVDLQSYDRLRIADMWDPRQGHGSLGLAGGTLMVSGGYNSFADNGCEGEIEIYDPTRNEWFKAGQLNTGRCMHQAIQLPNGEIFVYSGYQGSGSPGDLAPPEIGRCELTD